MVLAVATVWTSGCSHDRPMDVRLDADVHRPERCAVIFLVDGLDRTTLLRLAGDGRLPNIERVFLRGGVGVENAVTSLPSVTYPNCSALITGVYPGHHGIMGNFWFDRADVLATNYASIQTFRSVNEQLTVPTLYDLLGDAFTLSIHNHTSRGATASINHDQAFFWSWVVHAYLFVDRHIGDCVKEAAKLANKLKKWPTVLMTYYPGVDETGHQRGPDSEAYAAALENIDGIVGRVTEGLDRAGLGASTYYCLIADHGMVPIGPGRQFDLVKWLREAKGIRLHTDVIEGRDRASRLAKLVKYDALGRVDAGREMMLHLRGERGWEVTPTPEEIRAWVDAAPALTDLDAVDMVLAQLTPDSVQVLSRRGTARIERRGSVGAREYRLVNEQGDPVGYMSDPSLQAFAAEGWHDSRNWLAASSQAARPDFVAQAVALFDSPHTGDVVVLAAEDWSLYTGEAGGHGACLARDMHIPMFFSGPGLPAGGRVRDGRMVDFTPTLLGLLGRADALRDVTLDGINLADGLRSAKPPSEPQPAAARTRRHRFAGQRS